MSEGSERAGSDGSAPGWPPPGQPGHYGQYGQYGQPGQSTPPQWGQYAPPQWGPQQQQPPQWGRPAQGGGPGPGYVAPPKPGVIPLRPLGLGEVLDGAFQAIRRNAKAMFGSALIFQVALVAVPALLIASFVGSGLDPASLLRGGAGQSQALMLALGLVGALFVSSLLGALSVLVLQGALVIPVSRAVLDRRTGFGQMWRLVRRRVVPLILLALLYLAATIAAYVVLVIAVVGLIAALRRDAVGPVIVLMVAAMAALVWVAVKLTLAPAALVLEDAGVLGAIRRSWTLTNRNWWRTFGITALAALMVAVITQVVSIPVSFAVGAVVHLVAPAASPAAGLSATLVSTAISALLTSVVAAVGTAFQSGVMALIYVDLRMRREGFDLVLMREAEAGADDGGLPGRPRQYPLPHPGPLG